MRTILRITAVAVLVAGLAACASVIRQPDVWLAQVRLVSLGFTGGVVDVELGVYNPNPFGIRAAGVRYDLEFLNPRNDEWTRLTRGEADRSLDVGGGDSATVVIPVEFNYEGLGGAIQGLLERGSFEYRLSGAVTVDQPWNRELGFRHQGTVTPDGVQ